MWFDIHITQEAFALPSRSRCVWGCFVVIEFKISFGSGQILFRTLKKPKMDLILPSLLICALQWLLVAWTLLQRMPGAYMPYPQAIFGRSARGVPSLPGPFDIWNNRYRLAESQWLSCTVEQPPTWSKEEQVTNTGSQISCTGCVLWSHTTIWYKSGRRDYHPSTSANMAGRRDSADTVLHSWLPQSCPEGQHFSEGSSENRNEWTNGTAGNGRKACLGWSLAHHVVYRCH